MVQEEQQRSRARDSWTTMMIIIMGSIQCWILGPCRTGFLERIHLMLKN